MQIGYFTERPYRWLPEELILKNRAFFAVSNRYFDREKAADDYHYYLDEYCYAGTSASTSWPSMSITVTRFVWGR
jgi:hypothetical protein